MERSEYVTGRAVDADAATGEPHAVLAEAAGRGGPVTAECGAQVNPTGAPWPPPEGAEQAACPVCARNTGAAV